MGLLNLSGDRWKRSCTTSDLPFSTYANLPPSQDKHILDLTDKKKWRICPQVHSKKINKQFDKNLEMFPTLALTIPYIGLESIPILCWYNFILLILTNATLVRYIYTK